MNQDRPFPNAEEIADLFCDFEAFSMLLKIATKDGPPITFSPENWFEEQVIFNRDRTGRDLMLKARQIGFSTIEIARDLQYALTHLGSQVLIVAHDEKLANQLFLQLRNMYQALRDLGLAPPTQYDNVRELVFPDLRSAIRVTAAGGSERAAESKGRSGTVHRLHATEVAFWAYAHTTMGALLSCVPDTGEVIIESTPNGANGLFYDLCSAALAGRGDYKFHFFPWYQHREYRKDPGPGFDPSPRDDVEQELRRDGCDDAQIAWWRSQVDNPAKGLDKAQQEYPRDPISCFLVSGRPYIEAEHRAWLRTLVREPIERSPRNGGELRIYARPVLGKRYVVGCDVSEGVGKDKSASTVLDWETGDVVAYFESQLIDPGDFGAFNGELGALYNSAMVAIERNNHGHAALESLKHRPMKGHDIPYPLHNIYHHPDKRPGWVTSSETRPVLWDALATDIRGKLARSPEAAHSIEVNSLIWDKDGKPRAANKSDENGAKDDGFVSWGIARQVRSRENRGPTVGYIHIPGL